MPSRHPNLASAALHATSSLQRTLARSVSCTGIGLHGGARVTATLRPASAGTGIVFRRVDLGVDVPAHVSAVTEIDHATTLAARGNGRVAKVGTVEHLMAALHGLGIDNCLVEVDADEVPILDGSALPWVELVESAGVKALARARKVRRVVRPFCVTTRSASVTAEPADDLRVTAVIDFPHPAIGRQEWTFTVTPRTFASEVAGARTFGFLEEVEALRRNGLIRGGSLENAVVLDDTRVVNGDLRFPEEFARHKALDLLGDLALTGTALLGHFTAVRAGHGLHVEMARRVVAGDECRLEDVGEAREARPAAGLSLAAMRAT